MGIDPWFPTYVDYIFQYFLASLHTSIVLSTSNYTRSNANKYFLGKCSWIPRYQSMLHGDLDLPVHVQYRCFSDTTSHFGRLHTRPNVNRLWSCYTSLSVSSCLNNPLYKVKKDIRVVLFTSLFHFLSVMILSNCCKQQIALNWYNVQKLWSPQSSFQ